MKLRSLSSNPRSDFTSEAIRRPPWPRRPPKRLLKALLGAYWCTLCSVSCATFYPAHSSPLPAWWEYVCWGAHVLVPVDGQSLVIPCPAEGPEAQKLQCPHNTCMRCTFTMISKYHHEIMTTNKLDCLTQVWRHKMSLTHPVSCYWWHSELVEDRYHARSGGCREPGITEWGIMGQSGIRYNRIGYNRIWYNQKRNQL